MAGLVLPRRAATIAAAAAIGLSGTASWAPGIARATGYDLDVSSATNTVVTVPATACGVNWEITGAAGGDSASFTGGHGETVTTTTAVPSGGQLLVQPGQRGGSGAGGTSGSSPSGGAGGAGAGGGGGASIVRVGTSVTAPPLLVVSGGGGAGTQADGGDAGADGNAWTSGSDVYSGGVAGAPNVPGAGGTVSTGAAGTNGTNGAYATGGSGLAGAGGGGGGYPGGGSGASDGEDGSGGGGGSPGSTTATTASALNGSVRGTWVPCQAPLAPGSAGVRVGDGRISLVIIHPTQQWIHPDRAPVSGYEYSLDGGGTWTTAATEPGDVSLPGAGAGWTTLKFTVNGLTNGQTYAVQVRATSAVGPGQASAPQFVTPQGTIAPPADVHAVVGPGAISVTWSPPPGVPDVLGYEAWVRPGTDAQSDSGRIECPQQSARFRSCVVVAPPGQRYTVSVAAIDGSAATVVTDVVPEPTAPPSVPTADGPLSTTTGTSLRAGQQVAVSGYDFLPGSTVNVYVYSTPRLLGSVTVDAQSAFSTTVTVPADLADGTHDLVASGVDGNGNPKYLVVEVSVTGGVAGMEPAAAGRAATGTGTGGSTLAYTGFEPLPWLTLGGVLLVAGSALVVAGRRRRAGA